MRHIDGDIRGKILRISDNTCYYFDEDGVYRGVSIAEAREKELIIQYSTITRLYPYKVVLQSKIYHDYIELKGNNGNLVIKVIRKLKPGDTIENFDLYLGTVMLERHSKPAGIDRFITKIEEPVFACAEENPNQDTFDFVYVYVNIITQWEEDRLTYIKKHKKEIFKMILDRIEASKKFQKFGIPINFLKVTNVILKRDSVLEVILELKI